MYTQSLCFGVIHDSKYMSLHLSNIAAVDHDSSRSHGRSTSRSRYRKNLAAFSLVMPRRSCRDMPSIVLRLSSASRDSILRKTTEQSSTLNRLLFRRSCTHARVSAVPIAATRGAASAMRECMSASLRSNRQTIMTSRCCCILWVWVWVCQYGYVWMDRCWCLCGLVDTRCDIQREVVVYCWNGRFNYVYAYAESQYG